jgi:hypothetical protein
LPKKTYKRFIVDSSTGKFLGRDGSWTSDETQAVEFDDVLAAIFACAKHRIGNAQILLRFSGSDKYDVRLPLRQSQTSRRLREAPQHVSQASTKERD